MSHYEITAWADFIRGVIDTKTRQAMQSHLDSGCRRCTDTVNCLGEVASVARANRGGGPTEQALRGAKAVFSLQREWSARRSSILPVQVSFDSALQPLAVGTRSLQTSQRRVVYRSGEYALDLKVEQEPDLDGLTLVGQLARGIEQPEPVRDVQVFVLEQDRVVAQCSSNPFGEFQSRFRSRDPLKLRLLLNPSESMEISVERPPLPRGNGRPLSHADPSSAQPDKGAPEATGSDGEEEPQ